VARSFRFYEKKRGHRRTGSTGWASFGEALFFGIMFLVGCGALALLLLSLIVPEWRANRHFAETRCTVLERRIVDKPNKNGTVYRPEVHIRYQVEGDTYEDWTYDVIEVYSASREETQKLLDEFEPGKQYPCWFDPMNPEKAVLVRGYSGWAYLLLLIPISFMTIGGVGLGYTVTHWNTSAERRAAPVQRKPRDQFEDELAKPEFPFIPADTNLTNSPGTTLRYRLPTEGAPGWALFSIFAAALLWNTISAVFAVMAFQRHMRGDPDWTLTIFVVPFLFAGVWLLAYLVRQLIATTGVGATRIEISHHPLYPGRQFQVLVSQAGRLPIDSLQVYLVCEERVTYRQGTDTRTEHRRIFEEKVHCQQKIETQPARPFETKLTVQIPPGSMHSFKAEHNEIGWRLIVRGKVAGWPDYERAFPVIVHPQPTAVAA